MQDLSDIEFASDFPDHDITSSFKSRRDRLAQDVSHFIADTLVGQLASDFARGAVSFGCAGVIATGALAVTGLFTAPITVPALVIIGSVAGATGGAITHAATGEVLDWFHTKVGHTEHATHDWHREALVGGFSGLFVGGAMGLAAGRAAGRIALSQTTRIAKFNQEFASDVACEVSISLGDSALNNERLDVALARAGGAAFMAGATNFGLENVSSAVFRVPEHINRGFENVASIADDFGNFISRNENWPHNGLLPVFAQTNVPVNSLPRSLLETPNIVKMSSQSDGSQWNVPQDPVKFIERFSRYKFYAGGSFEGNIVVSDIDVAYIKGNLDRNSFELNEIRVKRSSQLPFSRPRGTGAEFVACSLSTVVRQKNVTINNISFLRMTNILNIKTLELLYLLTPNPDSTIVRNLATNNFLNVRYNLDDVRTTIASYEPTVSLEEFCKCPLGYIAQHALDQNGLAINPRANFHYYYADTDDVGTAFATIPEKNNENQIILDASENMHFRFSVISKQ